MTAWTRSLRCLGLVMLALASCGCHLVYPGRRPDGPRPHIPIEIPREHSMVSLPDYIIEPPDILTIEAISLVPKAPYLLRPFDLVTISSSGLTVEDTLEGEFALQPDGSVQLGRTLGAIKASGRTAEQLQAEITGRLEAKYDQPNVWVTLTRMAAQQQITGEHLVAPDGKVNLGTYGRVRVVGMTIEEAHAAIREHLTRYLEDPEIAVDVMGYNSKVFYVVTQGAGLGDRVVILPVKGNETVLDAIGQIQGLQSNSSTRMWIARPGRNQMGGDQVIPIDWLAVTQRGDTSTNYQLLPGDRLYVSEDKLVALDTALGKIISPMERIFGVTLLGTDAVQRLAFFKETAIGGAGGGFGGGGVGGP